MSDYNYSQWNTPTPSAVAPAIPTNSTAYHAYPGYGSAASAAATTASYGAYQADTAAASTYPYQSAADTQSQPSQPLDSNLAYYQIMNTAPYAGSSVPPATPVAAVGPTAHGSASPVQPPVSYDTQYPPSAIGQQSFSQIPDPVIPRGPFEAVHRSQRLSSEQPSNPKVGRGGGGRGRGRGPRQNRGPRSRDMGPPGGIGSRDLGSRDMHVRDHGSRGMRPRGMGPRDIGSRDMGSESLGPGGPRIRGQTPRALPNSRQSFGARPDFQSRGPRPLLGDNEPPDNWNGPHGGWDEPRKNWEGPPDRWEARQVPPDRFNSKKNRDSLRGGKQGGERGRLRGKERFAKNVGKPPPLMGPGFDREKGGWRDRNRKRPRMDSTSEKHAKRRVDEDLNVTISARDGEDKEGFYCTVCKVTIKKGYEFQQHLRGRRHKQRVADQKEGGKADADVSGAQGAMPTDRNVTFDATLTMMPIDDPEAIRFYCVICRLVLLEEINKKAHDCTPSHLKRIKEIEDLKKSKQEDEAVCVNCVVVYKETDEDDHKGRESHKESLHWRMASCEVCTCKFNDTVELEKHFNLPRHFKQSQKLIANGLEPDQMIKYYENVQAAISEKRLSFCLICTTACGSADNMEIHNIVAAKYHERMNKEAAKAGPNQFYCFCCNRIIEEADRRAHGKSMKHKMAKEECRSWNCEDCDLSFDQERKLYPHLQCRAHQKQVEKRKALQRHSVNKFILGWKAKQADANGLILAQLAKLSKKSLLGHDVKQQKIEEDDEADGTNVDPSKEKSDGEEEEPVTEKESATEKDLTDMEVIPISGHFCTVCNVFYQFDAGRRNICVHVKRAKGIKEKPRKTAVASLESETGSREQASGEDVNCAEQIKEEVKPASDGSDLTEHGEAEERPENAGTEMTAVGDADVKDDGATMETGEGEDTGVREETVVEKLETIGEKENSDISATDKGDVEVPEADQAKAASSDEKTGEGEGDEEMDKN
ncbi:uncharacterized protein [Watersipora subatra]|uniref:uncharacterized protein isoform X2 n=1 Tax=Watersipora subatra TaxID=2589382 RepID=UPI00355B927E